ncbi:hypothetical protein D3C87_1597160 [compost metagenome]
MLKALVTLASIVITSPNLIGCLKETLSTEAVTTIRLQCFCAEIAAAMSIQCNNLPPIKLLRVLVSLGNTSSFMMVKESFGLLIFVLIAAAKVIKIGQPDTS